VSLDRVLEYFWESHDPTQVGGQGNDMGSQYRSIILYADPAQKAAAEKSRAEAQKLLHDPITTEIVPLGSSGRPRTTIRTISRSTPTRATARS
jgi:peptide-methionine (S)-S-oxide reductase